MMSEAIMGFPSTAREIFFGARVKGCSEILNKQRFAQKGSKKLGLMYNSING